MEILEIQKTPKTPKKYNCEKCNFTSSNKKDYNKHLLTAKHTKEIIGNNISIYKCDQCEQIYKTNSGLWKHKQKCDSQNKKTPLLTEQVYQDDFSTLNEPTSDASTILLLLKQNQDFKNLMMEQYTHLHESNQKNQELQQQLVDAVKNNTSSMTNCN